MDTCAAPDEIEIWEAVAGDLPLQRHLMSASSIDALVPALCDAALAPEGDVEAYVERATTWSGAPRISRTHAPPAQWLPVQLFEDEGGVQVEWHHFGFARLTEPFFEQSWAKAAVLPAQSLLRMQTPVDALLGFAAAPPPDGLVFHMSRCGSTLVAQMLAELDPVTVVAEAPVFDAVLRLHRADRLTPEHVRGAAGALMRRRHPDARHAVFKLDAWHTPCWPTLASVFPETPAVFLHRDPIEVLVSQKRRPGMHALPGQLPLSLYGFSGGERIDTSDHAAWAIAQIAQAGLAAVTGTYAQPVDYVDLPDALLSKILPHFGIVPDDHQRDGLMLAGKRYSKDPSRSFLPDSEEKRETASPELRARVAAFGLDLTHASLKQPESRPHAPFRNPAASVWGSFQLD